MYPYHNRIKQRIAAGELNGYEYVAEYNKIKPCLLLYFRTFPYVRTVREPKFKEYEEILTRPSGHKKNREMNTTTYPVLDNGQHADLSEAQFEETKHMLYFCDECNFWHVKPEFNMGDLFTEAIEH